MRIQGFTGAAAIVAAAVLAGCFHAEDSNKLVVGTEAEFAPFEVYNETSKEFEGFDMDLAREIAKRLDRDIEIRHMGFSALIPAVQQGQVDFAISSMSITENRSKQVAFSDPYYLANQSVMVKQGSSITSAATINQSGVRIGVQEATVGADVARGYTRATVQEFSSYPLAVQALKAGQVDAVLMDRPAQVSEAKNDNSLKIAFDIFTDDNYGIAVKKENTSLVNEINQALSKIKSDGTMRRLMDKWAV